jgi:aspartate kinase
LKVLKFGGASLKNADGFIQISKIIKEQDGPIVIILSGIYGVTNIIQDYLCLGNYNEYEINKLINKLKFSHLGIAKNAIKNQQLLKKTKTDIEKKLKRLSRLLKGVYYVEELSEKSRDLIISFGERLSIPILEATLNDNNLKSKAFEADEIGIITNGDYGNASAVLDKVSINLQKNILPIIKNGTIPIITGFFGCDKNGNTTLFGRNGSDYTASIIAYALDVETVEVWKDVDGFLSADPIIIKSAKLIDELSYDEAAELSYFGAKIIHPRTVDPLRKKSIKLNIKNIFNPKAKGSVISKNPKKKKIVKSVSFTSEIASIKIFGSGIGCSPGVLSDIVIQLSQYKINIKSVITSQTCITLLLEKKDLENSYKIISSEKIKTVERIEKIKDISLVCIVGEGIINHHGIAAKAFGAVAKKGINIEMISAGASNFAYYFIVKEKFIKSVIQCIHNLFFD